MYGRRSVAAPPHEGACGEHRCSARRESEPKSALVTFKGADGCLRHRTLDSELNRLAVNTD